MLGDLLSEETNPGEVHMDDPSYEARTNCKRYSDQYYTIGLIIYPHRIFDPSTGPAPLRLSTVRHKGKLYKSRLGKII